MQAGEALEERLADGGPEMTLPLLTVVEIGQV